jgi:hypothetical protein
MATNKLDISRAFLVLAAILGSGIASSGHPLTDCMDASDNSRLLEDALLEAETSSKPVTFVLADDCTTFNDEPLVLGGGTFILRGRGHTISTGPGADAGIFSVGPGSELLLNKVTLNGGRVIRQGDGGCIQNGGTVTLNNSTLVGCSSDEEGGAIHNSFGATLTLNNSVVQETGRGRGAIYNRVAGIVVLNSSIVRDNTGGGIVNWDTLTLNNSEVVDNRGGGIVTRSGTVTLNKSTVKDNTTSVPFGVRGGGISMFGDAILVLNRGSSVTDNSAPVGNGGGIYAHSFFTGYIMLNDGSTVVGNSAGFLGDDIYLGGGDLAVSDKAELGDCWDAELNNYCIR